MFNIVTLILVLILAGCATHPKTVHLLNTEFGAQDMIVKGFEAKVDKPTERIEPTESITIPGGTVFGGASSRQAMAIASTIGKSHNTIMWGLVDLRKRMDANKDSIQETIGVVDRDVKTLTSTVNSSAKELAKQHQSLETKIAKVEQDVNATKQGISSVNNSVTKLLTPQPKEIVLFFARGKSSLGKHEKERLIRYVDSLGSGNLEVTCEAFASPDGSRDYNLRLGNKRCNSVREILSYYYSGGEIRFEAKSDIASQKEGSSRTRYVRLVATPMGVSSRSDLSSLPIESAEDLQRLKQQLLKNSSPAPAVVAPSPSGVKAPATIKGASPVDPSKLKGINPKAIDAVRSGADQKTKIPSTPATPKQAPAGSKEDNLKPIY